MLADPLAAQLSVEIGGDQESAGPYPEPVRSDLRPSSEPTLESGDALGGLTCARSFVSLASVGMYRRTTSGSEFHNVVLHYRSPSTKNAAGRGDSEDIAV